MSNACETARSNLKSAQCKMITKYDINVEERSFKPSDKVLSFLPIPGRPLQARYFDPYTIEKKVSDLSYCVNSQMIMTILKSLVLVHQNLKIRTF